MIAQLVYRKTPSTPGQRLLLYHTYVRQSAASCDALLYTRLITSAELSLPRSGKASIFLVFLTSADFSRLNRSLLFCRPCLVNQKHGPPHAIPTSSPQRGVPARRRLDASAPRMFFSDIASFTTIVEKLPPVGHANSVAETPTRTFTFVAKGSQKGPPD